MRKSRDRIPENKLLKALNELEESIAKGDELEEADPEGGLSTEGEPLSGAAPRGRDTTRKSRRARSSMSSMSSSSDDGGSSSSSSGRPGIAEMMSAGGGKPRGKPVKKGGSMSSSASSDDRSSDGDSGTEKSFRARAEADETIRKGMVVNDFLEAVVDRIDDALTALSASITKSLREAEARLGARLDASVAKSTGAQQDFNARLAKAVSAIGNTVQNDLIDGMGEVMKSLADQPASSPRGKAILSKGEVNQPPWSGGAGAGDGDAADVAELNNLPQEKVANWLYAKAQRNEIDPSMLISWEAARYDADMLPPQIRKAMANDLIK